MIAFLKGIVLEKQLKSLILDVNGVGYEIRIGVTLAESIKEGRELSLKIYHHISDSEQSLFGFATAEDLEYFELLLLVPSIGPKTAMSVLDAAAPKILAQAVHAGDMTSLTNISGIGRRTAERIIVELKGKISFIAGDKNKVVGGKIQQETFEALVSIGFKPAQAKAAVQKLPQEIATVEEAVKAALKTS